MAQKRNLAARKINDDETSCQFDRFMSVFLLGGKISKGEITFKEAYNAPGRAEGEAREKINIARRMKAKGMKSSLIAEVTELPVAEIKSL